MQLKVVSTEDGSHTLYLPHLNEHYHSVYGAISESQWIYIDAGLLAINRNPVKILEIGLGTGLNALLTFRASRKLSKQIVYHSLEPYPIPREILSSLNYTKQLKDPGLLSAYKKIHESEWHIEQPLSDLFLFEKRNQKVQDYTASTQYDVIYFDAFAPKVQPEMWQTNILEKMFHLLDWGGLLITYSASGLFQRNLKKAGYQVKLLPGPKGKKWITQAWKRSF